MINIELPIEEIKKEVIQELIEKTKKHLTEKAEVQVASDYTLGYKIKSSLNAWIDSNLDTVVLRAINKVDIQAKVDKAVERVVLDKVHQTLKKQLEI